MLSFGDVGGGLGQVSNSRCLTLLYLPDGLGIELLVFWGESILFLIDLRYLGRDGLCFFTKGFILNFDQV